MFDDLQPWPEGTLVLYFGTFVGSGGSADQFCVLVRYAGTDEWSFYESEADFLNQFPVPEQFLASLHAMPLS